MERIRDCGVPHTNACFSNAIPTLKAQGTSWKGVGRLWKPEARMPVLNEQCPPGMAGKTRPRISAIRLPGQDQKNGNTSRHANIDGENSAGFQPYKRSSSGQRLWEREQFLPWMSSLPGCQIPSLSPGHIHIWATLNELSRLYIHVCIFIYIYTCMYM